MKRQNILQETAAVASILNVLVIGCCHPTKLYGGRSRQSEEKRTTGERAMLVVSADYGRLPEPGRYRGSHLLRMEGLEEKPGARESAAITKSSTERGEGTAP